jgi:hypothetical protein
LRNPIGTDIDASTTYSNLQQVVKEAVASEFALRRELRAAAVPGRIVKEDADPGETAKQIFYSALTATQSTTGVACAASANPEAIQF